MTEQSLPITFSLPDDFAYVIIEQEPWGKDVGRTSIVQGVLGIQAFLSSSLFPDPNCGGLEGFDTPLYLYPYPANLNFTFDVSHGDFLPGVNTTNIREEVKECSLSDSVTLDYPPLGSVSLSWVGKCYDVEGGIINRPSVQVIGRNIFLSEKVLGSIRVRYSVKRYKYDCRIEKREDSIGDNFNSVAFAYWDGGVEWKKIDPPSGYDSHEGNCGNGVYDDGTGDTTICSPHYTRYPSSVRANRHTKVTYCDQEIESDEIKEVVDYSTSRSDCNG